MEEVSHPTLYLNENIPNSLVPLLAKKGVAAVRTRDMGNLHFTDGAQLSYAAQYNYVLVTHNRRDFMKLHREWTGKGREHSGIIVLDPAEPVVLAERIHAFLLSIYPSLEKPFCSSPS